jgi:16S rRNA (cytosine1402-N4)-methyltransferase
MTVVAPHIPVMLDEVVAGLCVAAGETHVDATFGAGGYSRAIMAMGGTVIAFDRDPDAIAEGRALEAESNGALRLVHAPFSALAPSLEALGVASVDGMVFDIGVSSMQLDRGSRGFSLSADAVPDMRMAQEGETAAEYLNEAKEDGIANVIWRYGEEPKSRRIARAIVAARPITSTLALAAVVRKAAGWREGMAKDPAPRVFQAIRIHINGELDELAAGLDAAERLLRPGGRLAVVTFHSLEDRIVKSFMRERSGEEGRGSRHLPEKTEFRAPSFERASKAIRPGAAELARNPRARSATLRLARRTAAPAWTSRQGSKIP